jgi:PHD/YefM family antitoxin component YafN of YafNO toxin-antitoxin module
MAESVAHDARYLTDERGERLYVVLPVKEYERLLEALELAEDSDTAEERRRALEAGEDELIPFDQAVREIEEGRVGAPGAAP